MAVFSGAVQYVSIEILVEKTRRVIRVCIIHKLSWIQQWEQVGAHAKKMVYSGIWRRVVWLKFTEALEEPVSSIVMTDRNELVLAGCLFFLRLWNIVLE